MSWDVYVMKVPPGLETVDDLPDDFQLEPIMAQAELFVAISRIAPGADFSDPTNGWIRSPNYSIEIAVDRDDPVRWFMLYVREDGTDAADVVADIIEGLGLTGVDTGRSDRRFFSRDDARRSFESWQRYRDQAISSGPSVPSKDEATSRSRLQRRN